MRSVRPFWHLQEASRLIRAMEQKTSPVRTSRVSLTGRWVLLKSINWDINNEYPLRVVRDWIDNENIENHNILEVTDGTLIGFCHISNVIRTCLPPGTILEIVR